MKKGEYGLKKTKAILFTVITVLTGLYVFTEAPNLNPLFFDGALFWAVLISVYVGVWALLKVGEFTFEGFSERGGMPFSYVSNKKPPKWALVVIAIPWIAIAAVMLFSSVFFQWKAYRDQLGEPEIKKFTNEVQAVDISQIPIVDEALALQLAKKKLGERPALGSQVYLRDATIQMVDGELIWAVPLYHSGFFKWLTNMEGTPGYVIVSATNMNNVRYVEGYKIKYHPQSYLLFDVARKVRFGPGLFDGITDYSFELNDEGQPYWVVSTYKNKRGFALPEADGVILLNASTGQMEKHTIETLPEWVDRVQPEQYILSQINNRGNYVHGIFNFANKDKYMPSAGHNIVYNNGKCYLFTGLTSVGTDDSAIGFMMVDMVTKQPIMYEMAGATEYAAMRSAEGRVQDLKYQATQPIILNIGNQPTYFMTLKDNIGLIKQYAFVSVENFSTVGTGESMNAALRDYEAKLKDDGVSNIGSAMGEKKEVTGTVLRVANEYANNTTLYKFILTEESNKIYVLEATVSNELALTQPGDRVTISYNDSQSGVENGTGFDNLEFSQTAGASPDLPSSPPVDPEVIVNPPLDPIPDPEVILDPPDPTPYPTEEEPVPDAA